MDNLNKGMKNGRDALKMTKIEVLLLVEPSYLVQPSKVTKPEQAS